MSPNEWKEFWERAEIAAMEYNCMFHRIESGGGWRVLLQEKDTDAHDIEKEGILITEARFGFRGDTGESPYQRMIKIEWRGNAEGPVPFGMSRTRIVYVSQDPQAVFAILYA